MDQAPKPRKAPHPYKLTPKVQTKIVRMIRRGSSWECAALSAGIDRRTLFNWRKRGQDEPSGPLYDFFSALESARAQGEAAALRLIHKAAKERWQAAAWWLERAFPDRWAPRQKREITGPGGGPIEITPAIREMTTEQLLELVHKAEALPNGVAHD